MQACTGSLTALEVVHDQMHALMTRTHHGMFARRCADDAPRGTLETRPLASAHWRSCMPPMRHRHPTVHRCASSPPFNSIHTQTDFQVSAALSHAPAGPRPPHRPATVPRATTSGRYRSPPKADRAPDASVPPGGCQPASRRPPKQPCAAVCWCRMTLAWATCVWAVNGRHAGS